MVSPSRFDGKNEVTAFGLDSLAAKLSYNRDADKHMDLGLPDDLGVPYGH